MQETTAFLFDEHRRELVEESAIDPAVIAERGYRSIGRPTKPDPRPREELKRLGFPSWVLSEDWNFPGLHIPMYRPDGTAVPGQFKPRSPVANRDGKRMKYAAARGLQVLDVHPRWSRDRGQDDPSVPPAIRDVRIPLWITEGTKKADSLTSRGVCTAGLLGVFNWRSTLGTLGDWENVALKGREVTICFDADAVDKGQVRMAMERLGRWLKSKGAKVLYVLPPADMGKGVDDYFAAGGDLEALKARRSASAPAGRSSFDMFSDSALAESCSREVLDGRYLNVENEGWRAWNGRVWARVPDGTVMEAVREFLRDRYLETLDAESAAISRGEDAGRIANEVSDWRKAQSKSKIAAVLSLAQNMGMVMATLDSFDTHPDLLNTPAGVVDLATGDTVPHDPDLRMTKMTAVGYVPGAESEDLKTALQAIAPDAIEWLQIRVGQALTGHEPDDDSLVVLQGGGENGKTALMGGVHAAFGSYAALIPNTILLKGSRNADSGAATPTKMRLQGVRLAYIEETPEGRHLDTQVLKEIVGTGRIAGRYLFKNEVEFGTSHSLILNTNFELEVRETDHGTWRRLTMVPFPYRFVASEGAVKGSNDRIGDPGLKTRMRAARENQEAVLAWAVAGAVRLAAIEGGLRALPKPKSVVEAIANWRANADPILGYVLNHMVQDPGSWVLLDDVVGQVSAVMRADGQVASAKLISQRVKGHTGLPEGVRYAERVRTAPLGEPSRPAFFTNGDLPERARVLLGLRFRR